MRLFLNCLAASAGGGITYVRNVIPHLARVPGLETAVLAASGVRKSFSALSNVEFVELDAGATRRFWYEQFRLPQLLRSWRADMLVSTGNFALRNSPVPQLLLSRNSIYLSEDFYRDLRSRGEYRMWLDTRVRGFLARKSIHWADITVAPSEAFAAELQRWSGETNVIAIHHGFDPEAFARDSAPLPLEVEKKLQAAEGALKLLFVSHYNYYRNFETLFRALPRIRAGLANQDVKLLLTCKLAPGENPGAYRTDRAARLLRELGVGDMVVELGTVPYPQLHHLYRRASIYVTPAYTETFAHPLVEAMACGLPVVASDLAVHREICQEAAIYFPRFSPDALADCVLRVGLAREKATRLIESGIGRAKLFSWERHVQQILEQCNTLLDNRTAS